MYMYIQLKLIVYLFLIEQLVKMDLVYYICFKILICIDSTSETVLTCPSVITKINHAQNTPKNVHDVRLF